MPNVTMAFDESQGGWTSEYTFNPDTGLSLNNNYYTAHNGRLWRHNAPDQPRNFFYTVPGKTTVEFVFNDNPTVVKNFKSINYEGSEGWDASLSTNLENGSISATNFIKKEGEEYAWIRGSNNDYDPDLKSSAVAGIGLVDSRDSDVYTFGYVSTAVNVGDHVYRIDGPSFTDVPEIMGMVGSTTSTSITVSTVGLPEIGRPNAFVTAKAGDMIIYVKNNETAKSGIIGYYNVVTMTNNSDDTADLFSVNATTHVNTI